MKTLNDFLRISTWIILLISACTQAHALDYSVRGDVLALSGNVEQGDEDKLRAALTPEVRVVVLRRITSGDALEARRLGNAVADAKVTTVIQGRCNVLCSYLFLRGAERMVAATGKLDSHYIALVGPRGGKFGNPDARASAYFADTVDVPGDIWRTYFFPMSLAQAGQKEPDLRIYHPDAKLQDATVFGCDIQTLKLTECTPLPAVTALSMRFLTTAALFNSQNLLALDAPPQAARP